VIAHRLSTIISADRIYVLKAGRIVQSGTYEELMEREGPFRDLAARQIA
jgi:ABC-type multidrug transport system fused ATPase/permease subunit